MMAMAPPLFLNDLFVFAGAAALGNLGLIGERTERRGEFIPGGGGIELVGCVGGCGCGRGGDGRRATSMRGRRPRIA